MFQFFGDFVPLPMDQTPGNRPFVNPAFAVSPEKEHAPILAGIAPGLADHTKWRGYENGRRIRVLFGWLRGEEQPVTCHPVSVGEIVTGPVRRITQKLPGLLRPRLLFWATLHVHPIAVIAACRY